MICDMSNQLELKNKLIDKLKTISKDREFILSIVNFARHADDRKAIIDFIDNGKDVTYENIILLALTLYEEREEKRRDKTIAMFIPHSAPRRFSCGSKYNR